MMSEKRPELTLIQAGWTADPTFIIQVHIHIVLRASVNQSITKERNLCKKKTICGAPAYRRTQAKEGARIVFISYRC